MLNDSARGVNRIPACLGRIGRGHAGEEQRRRYRYSHRDADSYENYRVPSKIVGIGKTLAGRLLLYDALNSKFREMKLRRDPACPTCGEGVKPESIELIDYQAFCNVQI